MCGIRDDLQGELDEANNIITALKKEVEHYEEGN